jgi:hypothetical protein
MGEHKTNPVAIAAKRGELPPKPKPLSKRETERLLMQEIERKCILPYLRKVAYHAKYGWRNR